MGILSKLFGVAINNSVQAKLKKLESEIDNPTIKADLDQLNKLYSKTDKHLEWYCTQFPEHSICKDRKI